MTTFKKGIIILIHALTGWALCAAVMGVGMALLTLQTTLIIHAILAPIIFFAVAAFYYRRYNYTTPLQTAIFFTLLVIFMDFFVVALIIQRGLAMFSSVIGTWFPFILIFLASYLAGIYKRNVNGG